ncbi:cyclophilin-like fold protein [Lapidilactobacillus gannanensis]|uniref:Cyclophilin-like fold protein n=1 Tax=Lapidilactobacillus gannanensis TaxID=2486002 RepID=A0ABW4BMY7_9LACO|nr:cyclophilin-like fold protein [Lapidilactobacillus gannanensis]
MTKIKISIQGQELAADFNDSDTASELMKQMPLSVKMMNLYSREMTYRFSDVLSAKKAKTSGYAIGDIGYWKPRHSLVIFYKQTGEIIDQLQIIGHITGDVSFFKSVGDSMIEFKLENTEGK